MPCDTNTEATDMPFANRMSCDTNTEATDMHAVASFLILSNEDATLARYRLNTDQHSAPCLHKPCIRLPSCIEISCHLASRISHARPRPWRSKWILFYLEHICHILKME